MTKYTWKIWKLEKVFSPPHCSAHPSPISPTYQFIRLSTFLTNFHTLFNTHKNPKLHTLNRPPIILVILSRNTKVQTVGVQTEGCDHWVVYECYFRAEFRFALVLLEYVRFQMVMWFVWVVVVYMWVWVQSYLDKSQCSYRCLYVYVSTPSWVWLCFVSSRRVSGCSWLFESWSVALVRVKVLVL